MERGRQGGEKARRRQKEEEKQLKEKRICDQGNRHIF